MRIRPLASLALLLLVAAQSRAAVVVIGNFTPDAVTFSVAEENAKARTHKLLAHHVVPVYVTGPANITFKAKRGDATFLLDMYNAYLFLPDREAGLRLEGLELPGKLLERDDRPELNPVPRVPPVKVPVTLYTDDADPRAEKFLQKELRARFDQAAAVIEAASGIRPELAGFDTWKSDPEARTTGELLKGFEETVKVKPGALAVGYSSRKIDETMDPAFGAGRGLGGRHTLIREWRPKTEPERVEVLVHFLARALGAVGTPDPGAATRAKLDDGQALLAGSVMRLDPLNALALNLWADERRREPAVTLETLSPINRARLTRVYQALLKAAPGDALATEYVNQLERDIGKQPEPAKKDPDKPPLKANVRDEDVRKVMKAVTERAKRNTGPGTLKGDELTAVLVRAAAEAALTVEGPEKVSAFLIGLGVAMDDTGALADDAITASAVKDAETPEARKERIAALGNPTLRGRRDLCRRFFLGCATGEILLPNRAESVAVGRALFDLHRPTGLCFPALAAELAGIAFARALQNDPELLRSVIESFTATDYLPPMTGLRNGLSAEKFEALYGDADDDRFRAILVDISTRIRAMSVYK